MAASDRFYCRTVRLRHRVIHIMPYSEKGQFCTLKIVIVTTSAQGQGMGILVAILGHIGQHRYFEFVQAIDLSNTNMELESNRAIKNFTYAEAILATILVIIHLTKSRFELWQEFESNPYDNYILFFNSYGHAGTVGSPNHTFFSR